METEKFQDTQLASWRSRIVDGVIYSPKAGEDKHPRSISQAGKVFSYLAFIFYSGSQLSGLGLPTLTRAVCFTHSSD